jgi:hypothetical protein
MPTILLIYYGLTEVNKLPITQLYFDVRAPILSDSHTPLPPATLARLHSSAAWPPASVTTTRTPARQPPRARPPVTACQPPHVSPPTPDRQRARPPALARRTPDSRSACKFMQPKSLFVRNYPNIHFKFIVKYCN